MFYGSFFPRDIVQEVAMCYGFFMSSKLGCVVLKIFKVLPRSLIERVKNLIRRVSIPLLASLFFFALIHLGSGMNLLDRPQLKQNIEFAPPSITVGQCNITPGDNVATINVEIVVEDNRQLHYVVVDLASGGGGYYPTHSKLKKYDTGSRILAKGKDKILTLVAIHRLEDGTLEIHADTGFTYIKNNNTVRDETTVYMSPDENTKTISLKYATIYITRTGEEIAIGYVGQASGAISGGSELYIVTWACDWIDNEALSVSDCPQSRTYISSHKQLLVSQLVLAEGLYSRVFTIGYRPYQCLDYVGIEFSSQSRVVLLIGGSNVTYSSPSGLWGAVAINASAWDVLCSCSPARVYIGGRVVDIHFLRVPFYYTLYGLVMLGSLSMYGVLRYEKNREKNL